MKKFAVIRTYEYTRTIWVEASDEDEARKIAGVVNDGDHSMWTESDCHNLTGETVQEEE